MGLVFVSAAGAMLLCLLSAALMKDAVNPDQPAWRFLGGLVIWLVTMGLVACGIYVLLGG